MYADKGKERCTQMGMPVDSIVSAQPPLGYDANAIHPPASGYPSARAQGLTPPEVRVIARIAAVSLSGQY